MHTVDTYGATSVATHCVNTPSKGGWNHPHFYTETSAACDIMPTPLLPPPLHHRIHNGSSGRKIKRALSPVSWSTEAVIVPEPLNDQHLFPSLLASPCCCQTRILYDIAAPKFPHVKLTEANGLGEDKQQRKALVDIDAPSPPAHMEFTADCGRNMI